MQNTGKVWHREVIPDSVAQILGNLREHNVLEQFYLAGGTGLALHLGHRRSRDLDFFTIEEFHEERLLHEVQQLSGFSVRARERQTLHVEIEGAKVSFLGYPYPLLFPCETCLGVPVADPRDISCMKISAIASRGTKRDFIDLWIVANQHGLDQILALFKEKFAQADYSRVHVLKSLAFFDDAEKDPLPEMLVPLSWEEVKAYFRRVVPRSL